MTQKLISIWQQVQQLPRSGRWAVYGITIVVALAVYAYGILEVKADWDGRADKIKLALDSAAVNGSPSRVKEVESVVWSMGPVKSPANESMSSQEMDAAVNQVFFGKIVSKYNYGTESSTKMKTGSLKGVVTGDSRAESITGRVEFESTIETAVDIIAELEASPAIEAVKSVRLTKLGGTDKRISVKLELETWVVSRTTAGVGTGGRR